MIIMTMVMIFCRCLMMMNGDDCFLRRYNMYGAPVFKQESALGNMKKGANAVAKRAKQGIIVDDDDDDGIDEAVPIICLLISSIYLPSSSSQPPSSSSSYIITIIIIIIIIHT